MSRTKNEQFPFYTVWLMKWGIKRLVKDAADLEKDESAIFLISFQQDSMLQIVTYYKKNSQCLTWNCTGFGAWLSSVAVVSSVLGGSGQRLRWHAACPSTLHVARLWSGHPHCLWINTHISAADMGILRNYRGKASFFSCKRVTRKNVVLVAV